jgi:AcrR family transcriptional regulator
MGSGERRERARLEVRIRILDAARTLFAEEGPDHVTMRRIADMIEYTPTTIYQHFQDKNELLQVLIAEDFLAFGQHFGEVLAVPDPIERVDAMGRAYVTFAFTHPNHYRELFMTPLSSAMAQSLEHVKDRGVPERDAYAALTVIMREAMASGRIRPEHKDLALNCQVAWATLHGVAALAIAKMRENAFIDWKPVQEIFEMAMRMVMTTLLHPDDPYFRATTRRSIPTFPPQKDPQ